jgi:hypothetical protein
MGTGLDRDARLLAGYLVEGHAEKVAGEMEARLAVEGEAFEYAVAVRPNTAR